MAPKKGKRRRLDMETLPPDPTPIPDSFENVIKALVRPVVPKKKEASKES